MFYLFVTTLILSFFAYFLNGQELIAPSFLFSVSFLFASFFAVLNVKNWGENINPATFWVIILGIIEFIVVSYIIRILLRKRKIQNKSNLLKIFDISKGYKKLITIEIIQFIFIFIVIRAVKKVTGQSNISEAINLLNYSANGFVNESYSLPTYAKMMQTFNFMVGILGEYLFAKELIIKKHFSVILFVEVLFGFSGSLLNGSRGGSLIAVITMITFLVLIQQEKNNWTPKNNAKYIFYILMVVFVVLLFLRGSTVIVGRGKETRSIFEYVSIYVGAEIKNLDIFISNGVFPVKTGLFGQQTFTTIYDFLIKHTSLNIQPYFLDLPFQTINNYSLGNVYTTFYPWLYDFGYTGVVSLIFIMATISEVMYEFSLRSTNNFAPYIKLFYGGTIAPCIIFSFFSNRFYEAMNIINILLTIIIWMVLNRIFKDDMEIKDE